jgi:hypothetical protein
MRLVTSQQDLGSADASSPLFVPGFDGSLYVYSSSGFHVRHSIRSLLRVLLRLCTYIPSSTTVHSNA